MKTLFKSIVALTLGAGLLGCQITSAGLSPSSVPFKSKNDYTVVSDEVRSAQVYSVLLFGFLPVSEVGRSQTEMAKDRLAREGGGDELIEMTTDNFIVPLGIVTVVVINMTGKPVKVNEP